MRGFAGGAGGEGGAASLMRGPPGDVHAIRSVEGHFDFAGGAIGCSPGKFGGVAGGRFALDSESYVGRDGDIGNVIAGAITSR
jgi:hypothetical protein